MIFEYSLKIAPAFRRETQTPPLLIRPQEKPPPPPPTSMNGTSGKDVFPPFNNNN